jgi:LysM repeat protein
MANEHTDFHRTRNPPISRLAGLSARFYVRGMKRKFLLAGLAAHFFCLPARAPAQDGQESPVAAAAERENTEANFKQVNVKLELLEEALRTQQRRIGALVNEIHALKEEVDRLKARNESAATQESIKRLAEKIEEVDKKRRDDNELVLAQLKAIGKGLSKPAPLPKESVTPPPASTKPDHAAPPPGDKPPDNGYTYKIKKGDYLSRIVKDLNAQGFKVTQKQIEDANPGVNWNNLAIGRTIFIPQPTP